MKSLIQAVVVAAALSASTVSFAQSASAVTREQVRAEIVQLDKAGYHVGDGDNAHYPDAIQAAQARIAAQNGAASGYGGASGSAQSGSAARAGVSAADWNAMYTR